MSSFVPLYILALRQGFAYLGQQMSSQDPPVPSSSILKLQAHTVDTGFFCVMLGIRTQDFMLAE